VTHIVIDTNVIVSAALSAKGYPAQVAALISQTEDIQVFYSTAIMNEYRRVLSYNKLRIPEIIQDNIISALEVFGTHIEPSASDIILPDESDRIFYDTAKASKSILITGNTKHFPDEDFIVTPAEFVNSWKERVH